MTEARGTQGDVEQAGHSSGEADEITTKQTDENTGSDVGGPATTGESAAERTVTGTSSLGQEDEPGDQAVEPS